MKRHLQEDIQNELDSFGLWIYNANVRELADAPDSSYLALLSQKAHEGATNQAKVDAAEAQYRGNAAFSEHKTRQARQMAENKAKTVVLKTKRDTECAAAEAELNCNKAGFE